MPWTVMTRGGISAARAAEAADSSGTVGRHTVGRHEGASLPIADLAAAVQSTRALALGLSLIYPHVDPRPGHELARLRRLVAPEAGIIAHGATAASYAESLERADIALANDMMGLESWLEGLRREPGRPGRGQGGLS